MPVKSASNNRKSSKRFKFGPLLILLAILFIGFITYLVFRQHESGKRLVPISIVAVGVGLIFEAKRLFEKWSAILILFLGSFAFSLLSLLPGKNEQNYSLEHHLEIWPYAFILLFCIFSTAFNPEKTTIKLTEGITLLQSIAIIYWVIDYGFKNINSLFLLILIVLGLLFCLYSFFHAFSNTWLSGKIRFYLSIWSSFIMILFAIDNIYRIYQTDQIENSIDLNDGIYIGLQYFLLGISAIYIVRNLLMLTGFLPGKGTFFNAQYFADIKQLRSEHIKRYSNKQVSRAHSLYCIFFSGTFFGLNYYFQFLPRHTAIWVMFLIFPLTLYLFDHITGKEPNIES